ncbi:predicted protein [Lichtheimia corymbifera JMRC:FSU:9682]|uniref:BZIP domain-containing protein n=1 Tax=Lichtheimia corymbifera JMRC:FSU:9682 TaxID=1263082 RepID=A0A068RH83_9FUNG|nr:predicted protein [Lichtheimia corymbifera JMRC:FSU:9682]
MLSSASSAPDTTTNHPIMSISSLLEPSSSTSDHVLSSTPFMRQDSLCIPPPPLVLPPMISPSTTSSHHEDDEMLLPPLDKTLFTSSSSSSSGGSRSPSPDPRDIPTSLEERRRRNKIASAKYRAKRSQENKNMRQALEHLRRQNAVLLQALNDVYRDKSNMGDAAAAAEHQPPSWPLLTFTSAAAAGAQGHDDGNIHCATHTYPTMSL